MVAAGLVACQDFAVRDFRIVMLPEDSLTKIVCPVLIFGDGAEAVRARDRGACDGVRDLTKPASAAQQIVADSTCLVLTHTNRASASFVFPEGTCDEELIQQ